MSLQSSLKKEGCKIMKRTQIILRVISPEDNGPREDIDNFPSVLRNNIFVIISRISSELENDRKKKFYASPDTIERIARSVSSLQLCLYRSDVIIHCFNDVPSHVALI